MRRALLEAALERRADLLSRPDLTAYRLLHGRADGLPGLVIERLGPVLILQVHEAAVQLSEREIHAAAAFFHERLGTQAVYRKFFVKDRAKVPPAIDAEHHRAEPYLGTPVEPEITILENGLRLLVRPYAGFSTGIFLEQRDNRARVRAWAAGGQVLNTFSYTCGFSVAAAVGGARGVDSVDVYKRYLEWGKANFAANQLPMDPHRFFASDTMDFLRRMARQGRTYDLIILDPPTFARLRRPSRTFVLNEQLEALCTAAVDRLRPGGRLLLSVNDRNLTSRRMVAAIAGAAGAAGDRRYRLEHLPLPPDFHGDPAFSRAIVATFTD